MRSLPILFNGPMIRSVLNDSKTQTRRVFMPDKMTWSADGRYTTHARRDGELIETGSGPFMPNSWLHYCPFGQIGDQLWLRETWFCDDYRVSRGPYLKPDDLDVIDARECGTLVYAADGLSPYEADQPLWRPSIHMPRWASRITLEITDVRVERLADITREDAMAEGIGLRRVSENDHRWIDYTDKDGCRTFGDPRLSFWSLWESIRGPESVKANPWVWVIEFRRLPK